jgi:hypothetical protein
MTDPKPMLGPAAQLATISYYQSQQQQHIKKLEELSLLQAKAIAELAEITHKST